MCIFQSSKDLPPFVRLSLRTLQYLVIPLLSVSILVVGSLHLDECPSQPYLPSWHIVAGSSGLIIPILYLLFDEINPRLSRRFPEFSEFVDNVVVLLLPLYVLFELSWLITGSVWVSNVGDSCDRIIYVFSCVVILNFWIHVLTPLIFMFTLCCSRIFPYFGYCAYWKLVRTAMENDGTITVRYLIATILAVPLGVTMIVIGAVSLHSCRTYGFQQRTIPLWLLVAGSALLLVPIVYFLYDKYCKREDGGPLIKTTSQLIVLLFLTCGLAWAVVGFLWVFGSKSEENTCGEGSTTYQFAFGSLIILNAIMDVWICFKICVVLYWAFLSED